MEYDKCDIRKIKYIREDNSEIEGYALYLFKDGVIKLDLFVKEVIVHERVIIYENII